MLWIFVARKLGLDEFIIAEGDDSIIPISNDGINKIDKILTIDSNLGIKVQDYIA